MGGEIISSPAEWSHLPLKNGNRGYDPRITAFTYLVSSYDENGQLLPEFAERKKAIEAELAAQAPPPISAPPRKMTDSREEVKEALENMDFWPWLVGGGRWEVAWRRLDSRRGLSCGRRLSSFRF